MARVFEGNYSGKGLTIGIVVSRFNELITKSMLEGALNELRRAGVEEANLHVVWVPGAYEIPVAAQSLIDGKKPDALVALGCIIRGETTHYEHIAQSVSDHLQRIAVQNRVPVGFGVLTVENLEQAIARAGGKSGNKGRDAARSALEMACLLRQLVRESAKEPAFDQWVLREFKN